MREHGAWADARLLDVLGRVDVPAALRECAHVRGSQETWLARIEQRPSTLAVWPELTVEQLAEVGPRIDAGWRDLIARLADDRLDVSVSYKSVAGDPFTTPLIEILTHVMLHGQYHRGKANAILSAAGSPVALDFIVWQRMTVNQRGGTT